MTSARSLNGSRIDIGQNLRSKPERRTFFGNLFCELRELSCFFRETRDARNLIGGEIPRFVRPFYQSGDLVSLEQSFGSSKRIILEVFFSSVRKFSFCGAGKYFPNRKDFGISRTKIWPLCRGAQISFAVYSLDGLPASPRARDLP